MPRLTNAVSCIRACQKATQWLLDQQEKDGSYRDVEPGLLAYARSPYLLAYTGRVEELSRMLDWIRENLLDACASSRRDLELQAWLAVGTRAGYAFDVSARLAERLLELQGKHTGGLHDPDGSRDGGRAGRLGITAWAGLAFIYCGMKQAAKAAANFLVAALNAQRKSKDFYLCLDQHFRPITEFPGRAAREYVIRSGEKAQRELGWEPKVDFEEGMRRTIEWYRGHLLAAQG